jgi:hypothetical protein
MNSQTEFPSAVGIIMLVAAIAGVGQTPICAQGLPPLVQSALAAELQAAQDKTHPMCYDLRRASPRLTSTKRICETKDGAIALLLAQNDKPLTPEEAARERERLISLKNEPGRQLHRKQSDDADMERVLKILRALPKSFVYTPAGTSMGPDGPIDRFHFSPNPDFDPQSLETLPMTQMVGDIWIDRNQARVAKLEGHLRHDVDFGWGILGQLDKGGWIRIEQADLGGGQWRITHFQIEMIGRVVIKSRVFSSDQRLTHFRQVSTQMGYQDAIRMLLEGKNLPQEMTR